MIAEESLARFGEYKKLVRRVEDNYPEQRAIDGLGLYLLDGNIDHFQLYKSVVYEEVERYSPEQRAIDAISLSLLNGNAEKLKEYRFAVAEVENNSAEQRAIDALTLIVIDQFPEVAQNFAGRSKE